MGKEIIGGVDTHQDLHAAAAVTLEGTVLGTESLPTTRAGYRAMLAWFRAQGELLRVGVEREDAAPSPQSAAGNRPDQLGPPPDRRVPHANRPTNPNLASSGGTERGAVQT